MRPVFAFRIVLAAAPAGAQAPVQRLLDKLPSLFGGAAPSGPKLDLPATPIVPGLTRAAPATVAGEPATFDLGGFRLGMSESEVSDVIKARGYAPDGYTRFVDFESQVRVAISMKGGRGGGETHRSVLGETNLKDASGGRYALHMLTWPDGAHLSSITYMAPVGTPVAEWRRILVGKWGRGTEGPSGKDLFVRWGTSEHFSANAEVGPRGGSVSLATPAGSGQRPAELVTQAVDAYFAAHAGRPSL